MKKLFIMAFLTLAAVSIFAQDEEKDLIAGRDPELYREGKIGTNNCLVYRNYVVKTIVGSVAGETVNVFKRTSLAADPKASCRTTAEPLLSLAADYSGKSPNLDQDMNSYFYGISGKYMFIVKDVEPFQGAFDIFDLETRKSIFTAEYHPTVKLTRNRFVYYENWSEKDGAIKNCREARKWKKLGLGVGWVTKKQLDLRTLKVKDLGLRCEATQ